MLDTDKPEDLRVAQLIVFELIKQILSAAPNFNGSLTYVFETERKEFVGEYCQDGVCFPIEADFEPRPGVFVMDPRWFSCDEDDTGISWFIPNTKKTWVMERFTRFIYRKIGHLYL